MKKELICLLSILLIVLSFLIRGCDLLEKKQPTLIGAAEEKTKKITGRSGGIMPRVETVENINSRGKKSGRESDRFSKWYFGEKDGFSLFYTQESPGVNVSEAQQRIVKGGKNIINGVNTYPTKEITDISRAYRHLIGHQPFMNASFPIWGLEMDDAYYFSGSRDFPKKEEAFLHGYAVMKKDGKTLVW